MNEFEELIKNYNIKNKEDYDFLEKVKNIIERKENIIKEVRCVYQSLCFSAPENAYIFIEQLGEILDKLYIFKISRFYN